MAMPMGFSSNPMHPFMDSVDRNRPMMAPPAPPMAIPPHLGSRRPQQNGSRNRKRGSRQPQPQHIPPQPQPGRTRLSLKYKTEMCHHLVENGSCPYEGECNYAHHESELRPRLLQMQNAAWKTVKCKVFHEAGVCPFGERCAFVHTRSRGETLQAPTGGPVSTTNGIRLSETIANSHMTTRTGPKWYSNDFFDTELDFNNTMGSTSTVTSTSSISSVKSARLPIFTKFTSEMDSIQAKLAAGSGTDDAVSSQRETWDDVLSIVGK